jgi:hypothetical protein
MRRRITILMATAVVTSTVFAGPAQAAVGKKCNRSGDQADAHEVRCCIKKADTKQEERRCIQQHV